MLAYKGSDSGVEVTEIASLDEQSTDRAAKAAAKKAQRKARKLGDAVRELKHTMEG